jgi:hypothetical protein
VDVSRILYIYGLSPPPPGGGNVAAKLGSLGRCIYTYWGLTPD